ncbi:AI-2E family transporter [Corynebacterium yudongzhengii]|uniref:AI-2E family transporter n=1 Tax=Corynebacterium yudongzhengii TaxID=2080740 RepID=A0A2U1T4Q2_9CORY|nr:AI-2E family transporter [Corynebacterium yudongzhengii]AWB82719.1 AI-2E family transporter [Corynebacterium yudongzhengii]PWC00962.1 AI-2E family transporter [Corynebacterium yudongzhengii]
MNKHSRSAAQDDQRRKPDSPRHSATPKKDFADTLPDSVEGQAPGTDYPRQPAVSAADEKYDRSAIIGHDGRVVAGWALRFIVIAVALYLAGQVLSYIWVGLLPVILAILVSTVLWPTTRFLRNRKFPAALAALTSILGFFLIVGGVFAAMAPVVRNQGAAIVDQMVRAVEDFTDWLQTNPFGLRTAELNLDQLIEDGLNFLQEQSQNIASGVFAGVSAISSVVVTLVIMMIITFFMLKDGDRFLPMLRRCTGTTTGWHLSEVLTRTWNTLSGFIMTQALVSFIDALFIGIGLWILGVPLAFVLAVITFFAGFIPIVGAFSAGALAVIIALVTQGFTTAIFALILIVAVQQIEGNVLQPILQSKAMNLHAAVVLLSVTLGSTLFGIIGAFLAVPIAAALAVWVRYHSEMVALRAGEITVDDVEIATAAGQTMTSREAFNAVREHLATIGPRKPSGSGSTAASKSLDAEVAEDAVATDRIQDPNGPDGEGEWLEQPYDENKPDKS